MTVWSRNVEEALAQYVADGLSASQVADKLNKRFGISVTRNAVIGKVSRSGLEFARGPQLRLTAEERAAKKARRKRRPSINTRAMFQERKQMREALAAAAEPTPRGDVDDGCRYLHGEALMRNFCGAPKSAPTSWCAFHRNKCFDLVRSDKARHLKVISCEAA